MASEDYHHSGILPLSLPDLCRRDLDRLHKACADYRDSVETGWNYLEKAWKLEAGRSNTGPASTKVRSDKRQPSQTRTARRLKPQGLRESSSAAIAARSTTPTRAFGLAPSERQDDLKTVLAHTPFLLTRCSADLRYLFVSQSYARMLGKRPEDIAGKPILEIIGEQGFATILPYIQRVLQGERVEYETEVHFAGAGLRNLHVIYTPERGMAGQVTGWIASILDISAEKKRNRSSTLTLKP
jgi:PAS domain S-box-containing protein